MRGKTSGVDNVSAESEEKIVIVANGEVRASGLIEIYTAGGALYASAVGSVSVSTPGVYVVKTADATRKMVVR